MNIYTKGQIRYADLILILGQSNAVGQATDVTLLPSEWQGIQPHINVYWEGLWSNDTQLPPHFEKMIPGYNSKAKSGGGYGVEQSLAQRIHEETLNEVYIIKTAVGGQSISSFQSPSGLAWGEMSLFIPAAIDWLLDRGITPRFRAIAWLQGESAEDPNNYADQWGQVISDVRGLNHTYLDNAPWFPIYLRPALGSYATVTNSQMDLVATNDALIHPLDCSSETAGHWDGLHYDGIGLLAIGQKIFDYMKANNILYQ